MAKKRTQETVSKFSYNIKLRKGKVLKTPHCAVNTSSFLSVQYLLELYSTLDLKSNSYFRACRSSESSYTIKGKDITLERVANMSECQALWNIVVPLTAKRSIAGTSMDDRWATSSGICGWDKVEGVKKSIVRTVKWLI